MTAEFDSSGFSALDKFFGKDEERTSNKPIANKVNRTNRRGGVGAKEESKGLLSSDRLSKKVMAVGKKRSRDDDDDDEYQADLDHHGLDRDVDEGRTSIAQPKKASGSAKKKLGKKERQKQKELEKPKASVEVFEPASGDPTETVEAGEAPKGKTKRKRKKVRSRQKNIRKDNRSNEEKPAHLIPGSKEYQGRPMTQATRDKLNLPKKKKDPKKPRQTHQNHSESHNGDLFVIDRNPDSNNDLGVQLAIDEFMDENHQEKTTEEKASSIKQREEADDLSKRKKKRKRFKNL